MGGRGAAGRRLRLGAARRTGQVQAPHPGRDRRVEGQLPHAHRRGGAGGDGQRRRGGELPAEAGRFVVGVLGASVVLVGGEEQLQRPEQRRRAERHEVVDGLHRLFFRVTAALKVRAHRKERRSMESISVFEKLRKVLVVLIKHR